MLDRVQSAGPELRTVRQWDKVVSWEQPPTGPPALVCLSRDRFVRCFGNASISVGRQRWFWFLVQTSFTTTVAMTALVCNRSWFCKLVSVIGACQRQSNAFGCTQLRSCRCVMSCIVVNVTTRRFDWWPGRRQTRFCTRLSRLESGYLT